MKQRQDVSNSIRSIIFKSIKENKKIWFWAFALFILFLTLQAAQADLTDDLVSYYGFNEESGATATDSHGDNDGTISGATRTTTAKKTKALSFDGTDDYLSLGDWSAWLNTWDTKDKTINFWLKLEPAAVEDTIMGARMSSNNRPFIWLYIGAEGYPYIRVQGDGTTAYREYRNENNITTNNWVMLTYLWDVSESRAYIYINGNEATTAVSTGSVGQINGFTSDTLLTFGGRNKIGTIDQHLKGIMDELMIYDDMLSSEEIGQLYASASGLFYPFLSAQAFTITAKDFWDDSSINSFWAYINSVNYTTTNGTIYTSLLDNDTNTYTLQVGGGGYFDRTFSSISPAAAYDAKLYASDIKFRGYELLTGAEKAINITIGGVTKTHNQSFYLKAGNNYNATITRGGYYTTYYIFNVTGRDNTTKSATGIYNAKLTISPRDVLNNNTISGANITISQDDYTFSSTAAGVTNTTINLISGLSYAVEISAANRTDYKSNHTPSAGASVLFAPMYAYNSLWVYAYKASDLTSISTFNSRLENENNTYNAAGSGGVARFSNVLSGSYTLTITATNYSQAVYTITQTDNSFQILDVYLSAASDDEVIFTLKNKNTNAIIEGVSVQQRTYINSSLVLVGSRISDISGRVKLTYEPGTEYYFTTSATGYEPRNFTMEILFSSYTILLTPTTGAAESVYNDDVTATLLSYDFPRNGTGWAYILINSPGGSLETYQANFSTPGGSGTTSGNQASGEYLNITGAVTGLLWGQTADIKISYKSVLNAGSKTLVISVPVTADGAVLSAKNAFSGVSRLEQLIIGTIITLILGGVFALAGGLIGSSVILSGVGVLFGLGISVYLGLFSAGLVLIPFLLIVLYILARSGD